MIKYDKRKKCKCKAKDREPGDYFQETSDGYTMCTRCGGVVNKPKKKQNTIEKSSKDKTMLPPEVKSTPTKVSNKSEENKEPKKTNIVKILDLYSDFLKNPPEIKRQPSDSNYPSSSSIEIINCYGEKEIIGSCLRREAYRRLGFPKTDPDEVEGILKMKAGKAIEEFIVEDYMKMGIWRGNNIKLYIKDLNISGEIDVFTEIPINEAPHSKVVGVELKTSYGDYFDVQVLGIKCPFWLKIEETGGYPKIEHLLQLLPYLYYCIKHDITDEFRLQYFNRGSFKASREYIVTMAKDGYLIIDGIKNDLIGLEPMLKRFRVLDSYVDKKELPPRDFAIKYSEEYAKKLVETGRKKSWWLNNWKKNKGICGDWMCSFCGFRTECWKTK